MNRAELLAEIKEALQKEGELTENMVLGDLEEWDSLAKSAIVVLYNRNFSKQIKYGDVNNLWTVGDLIKLVEDKLEQ